LVSGEYEAQKKCKNAVFFLYKNSNDKMKKITEKIAIREFEISRAILFFQKKSKKSEKKMFIFV